MTLKLNDIKKTFEDKVLDGLSYEFGQGIYCITGSSGIGKTTLLNIIAGLLAPDEGSVMFDSGDARIGVVFQEDRLCEDINALKNVLLVGNKQTSKAQVIHELERVGLKDSLNIPVKKFSGGMKRRVAIVRAMINRPKIVLMDEPFKGLDASVKDAVIEYIKEATAGAIVIIVTHDKSDADKMGGRLLYFKSNELSQKA